MSAAHSLQRKFGAVELPLADTGATSFTFLDPARDILLDLFYAAIDCELGEVWPAAVANSPLLAGTTPIVQKLPSLPTAEVLGQMSAGFPLLSVGRDERPARRDDYTLEQDKLVQRWNVDYILGPLALQAELQVRDVLQFVVKTAIMVVRQGGHRAYRTDANGRVASVLGDGENCCGFYALNVIEATIGAAAVSKEAPRFHAATIVLESEEVTSYVGGEDPDAVPLLGTTGTFGVTQSGDPPIIVKG